MPWARRQRPSTRSAEMALAAAGAPPPNASNPAAAPACAEWPRSRRCRSRSFSAVSTRKCSCNVSTHSFLRWREAAAERRFLCFLRILRSSSGASASSSECVSSEPPSMLSMGSAPGPCEACCRLIMAASSAEASRQNPAVDPQIDCRLTNATKALARHPDSGVGCGRSRTDCAGSAMAPLAVFIVFFGPSPPWMPLTLHSMSLNAQVKFVVIGDAAAPDVVPPNVVFEHISYAAMQARLSQLLLPGNTSSVRYNWTYKANDIKPFAPALYPQHVAGYEWWAWADMDMVFGDLLRFMAHAVTRPACCKVQLRADGQPQSANKVNVYQHKEACPCDPGAQVNVISPLYPNPWRKKVWGPFTAFRTGLGTELFRESPHWRSILATNKYAHFDEWWGPFHDLGWETMGDVVTRLAEVRQTLDLPLSLSPPPPKYPPRCAQALDLFFKVTLRILRLSGAWFLNGD
eukprot:scaffold9553_cov114-Isochrysis_galbana.AAC.10